MGFQLRLFGVPAIQLENGVWQDILSTKPALLLLYLAFSGDWVTREALASIFQPIGSDESVRRYLRVILNRTKDLPLAPFLEVEATRLRLRIKSDVQQFEAAIAAGEWVTAYDLHKKTLFGDYTIRDTPSLELWLELERERLQSAWKMAALRLAKILAVELQHQKARVILEQLLSQDPIQEDVVIALMHQCVALGARQDAIRAFEQFRSKLETELGLEPMPETLGLLEQIRQSKSIAVPLAVLKNQPIPSILLRPPRLLGREIEITEFNQANTPVRIFLAEAGAGKTRLLQEIAPTQAPWLRCREGLEGIPYQPMIEWIRSNLHAIPELGAYREDLARLIPEIAPHETFGPAEPSSAKARLLEALARVFEVSPEPIIIDDLQWIDQSSLEALVFTVTRQKIRLIAAARHDEISPLLEQTLVTWRGQNNLYEIKLEPLSFEQLKTLIEDVSKADTLSQEIQQQLLENSGGNVFFALETLRDYLERDAQDSAAILQIPKQVKHLIGRRIKRLSETTQRILQAASVMREGFTPKYLSEMIGISEFAALDALEETENTGFTKGNSFQHDLVRQSLYTGIQETKRKALHARAATILEATADALLIGNHWLEAEKLAKAVPKLLIAAEEQHYLGNSDAAIAILENVLQHNPSENLQNQTWLKLATIYDETNQLEQLKKIIDNLLQENVEPLQLVEILDLQSNYLLKFEKIVEICQVLEKATEILKAFDPNNLSSKQRLIPAKLAYFKDDIETALNAYLIELEYQKNMIPSANLVQLYSDVASTYGAIQDFENSECMALKSYELAQQLKIRHLQVSAVAEYGYACTRLQKNEQWLEIGEATLALGNYEATEVVRNNLVSSYSLLGRSNEVIHHSGILAQESTQPRLRAASWSRIAVIHIKNKDLEQAQVALENTLVELPKIQDNAALTSVIYNLIKHGTKTQQNSAALQISRIQTRDLSAQMKVRLEEAEKIWAERQLEQ